MGLRYFGNKLLVANDDELAVHCHKHETFCTNKIINVIKKNMKTISNCNMRQFHLNSLFLSLEET
jgi:hypothetical protein